MNDSLPPLPARYVVQLGSRAGDEQEAWWVGWADSPEHAAELAEEAREGFLALAPGVPDHPPPRPKRVRPRKAPHERLKPGPKKNHQPLEPGQLPFVMRTDRAGQLPFAVRIDREGELPFVWIGRAVNRGEAVQAALEQHPGTLVEVFGRTLSKARLRKLDELLKQGKSFNDIAVQEGIAHKTLRRYFPGRGLSKRETGLRSAAASAARRESRDV